MTIERITPTEAEAATINELMNAKFPVTVSSIAGKLGMTELEAARRLPADRVSFVTGDKRAMGYYNILAKDAVVGGHIAYEKIKAAAFVTMPFMGRESLSVLFFDAEGRVSFSVYAGRENHQIIESVKTAFFADREKFCA